MFYSISNSNRHPIKTVMFGYLQPYKEELKVKDLSLYKKYYCALCYQIRKDYGVFFTPFLNYEMVYLYIILNLLSEDADEVITFRCPLNVIVKNDCKVKKDLLEYVAFCSMLLLYNKLIDNYSDEKNVLYKLISYILSKKKHYKKEYNINIKLSREIEKILKQLSVLEKSNSTSLDDLANTTGEIIVHMIKYYLDNKSISVNNSIYEIHYHLGKWIYILDAYEDYYKDIKKKRFNPIIYMNDNKIKKEDKVYDILKLLIFSINNSLNKIESLKGDALIKNILGYGLTNTLQVIAIRRKKDVH